MKAADSGVSGDDFDVDSGARAVLDDGVLDPVSTRLLVMVGRVLLAWSGRRIPAAFSERLAAVTFTAGASPIVSVRMPRFRSAIFFVASVPWLVRGTLAEVFNLWVSITEAVGSGLRPSLTRAGPVRP
jgi:hypothetical protein